jgi:hypothetical protein
MFGLAPILDFDGTLARLDVDWEGLRCSFNVKHIDDLWNQTGDAWSVVAEAEVKAASEASAVCAVLERLPTVQCFAVLTNNDSGAVRCFVNRFPSLKDRLSLVVGRRELGGPKTDFAIFESGMRQCLRATNHQRRGDTAVYVGDAPYELEFASRLGLIAVDVKTVVRLNRSREG